MQRLFLAEILDAHAIVRELQDVGALSLPCLAEQFRRALADEARGYQYRQGRERIGSGERLVLQRLAVFNSLPPQSAFFGLRDAFEDLLRRSLASLDVYPFETPLRLDDMMLQRYEPGDIGITPHRDRSAYINLVCSFNIEGRGSFRICTDRSGRGSREIAADPGSVILMRAPGFRGAGERPFHAVGDIRETRFTFGLRQNRPPGSVE